VPEAREQDRSFSWSWSALVSACSSCVPLLLLLLWLFAGVVSASCFATLFRITSSTPKYNLTNCILTMHWISTLGTVNANNAPILLLLLLPSSLLLVEN